MRSSAIYTDDTSLLIFGYLLHFFPNYFCGFSNKQSYGGLKNLIQTYTYVCHWDKLMNVGQKNQLLFMFNLVPSFRNFVLSFWFYSCSEKIRRGWGWLKLRGSKSQTNVYEYKFRRNGKRRWKSITCLLRMIMLLVYPDVLSNFSLPILDCV